MEKKLNAKQYMNVAVVYAAIFAIYNIIVLLAFENKNNIFWISYSFMCIAFIVNITVTLYSFKSLKVEAVFMGIPLLSLSVFYFFGELFISFVFMLFKAYAGVKLTVAIQTIYMLLFVIAAAMALLGKDAVESINKNVETNVKTIKLLSVDVSMLEQQCLDSELKAELHKVSEAIKYSDPMTNEYVADLDELIHGMVKELKYQCNSNNKNEAMQLCYKLSSIIAERNQKLMITK